VREGPFIGCKTYIWNLGGLKQMGAKKTKTVVERASAMKGPARRRKWFISSVALLLVMSFGAGCSSSKSDSGSKGNSPAVANTAMADTSLSVQDQNGAAKQEAKQDMKASSQSSESGKATAVTAGSASVSQPQAKGVSGSNNNEPLTVTPAIGMEGTDGFNRKLIYKANMVMPVEDYAKAQTQLRDLVALSGAYILQFSENTNTGERGGNFTIKVAANGFVSLLDGLEKISPSLQRSVQGQDVTEEYVDLASRLKAKQAVESRLLGFMDKAVKTDELLAFSNELAKVQEEIEKIKGRVRYLDQNVSYSTVELRMYQQTGARMKPMGESTLGSRLQKSLDASLHVLSAVVQGILVVLAAALPILVLLVILLVPFLYYRRKKNQKLSNVRTELKQQNSSLNTPTDETNDQKSE
jgi:hypothetical protein